MAVVLCVRSLWKGYAAGVRGCSARVSVLRGLSLAVDGGERVLVVGDRGSGKTTLLHCIAGLRRPDAGTIHPDPVASAHRPVALFDDGEWQSDPTHVAAGPGAALFFARAPDAHARGVDRVLLLRDGRLTELDLAFRSRRVAEAALTEGVALR